MADSATRSPSPASGVVFPQAPDGHRSTTELGRQVVADALQPVDPDGARSASGEADWRRHYLPHFRSLVEAGLGSPDDAITIARSGLTSLHARMRVAEPDGRETTIPAALDAPPARRLRSTTIQGTAAPDRELSIPYRGERLRGDALLRRLDAWVDAGVMEPSAALAVRTVADNPDWLSVPGARVVVLGAGAEMGPLPSLLRWGADVIAVDLPRTALWQRVLGTARSGAGRLTIPLPADAVLEERIAENAGADLLHELPAVAHWIAAEEGPLVLGNYVYADGATNVRVAVAVDALTQRLQEQRPDIALAFLATPTDVFAVPAETVAAATRNFEQRSRLLRLSARPLRIASRGRLLQPAYPPGSVPGIIDSLVPQQGPNYALAKRMQRWRATVARAGGAAVSLNVAPPTRTRSVVKNRALATAYAGAHRFGVEIFEPATSNTLMAALLVHDLYHDAPSAPAPKAHPVHAWEAEARTAVHGGLWRAGYAPRSALGLAALLGLGSARG